MAYINGHKILMSPIVTGGRAIVDVDSLPTENIKPENFYHTPEGVFWYDGGWHKVVDESGLEAKGYLTEHQDISGKQDKLSFDGTYNASTNKVATVQTVTNKVAQIVANAPEDFDTLQEMADWLATHGNEAAKMNSDIIANAEAIAELKALNAEYLARDEIFDSNTAILEKTNDTPSVQVGSYNYWYRVSEEAVNKGNVIGGVITGAFTNEGQTDTTIPSYTISHKITESDIVEKDGGYSIRVDGDVAVHVVSDYASYASSAGVSLTANGVYLSYFFYEFAAGGEKRYSIDSLSFTINRVSNKVLDLKTNSDFKALQEEKLDKLTGSGAYVLTENGAELIPVSIKPADDATDLRDIVRRNTDGSISIVSAPKTPMEAANKGYVDTAVRNIKTPTKVSAFENDAGYLTQHQDISGKQDKLSFDGTYNATTNKVATVSTVTSKIALVDTAIKNIQNAGYVTETELNNKGYLTQHQDISGKQDKLTFDGTYNASTNKAATVKTVTDKIAAVVANAPDDFNTLKEMSDWIDSHEDSVAGMNSSIKANTDAITALDNAVANKLTANGWSTELGKLSTTEWDENEHKLSISSQGIEINRQGTIDRLQFPVVGGGAAVTLATSEDKKELQDQLDEAAEYCLDLNSRLEKVETDKLDTNGWSTANESLTHSKNGNVISIRKNGIYINSDDTQTTANLTFPTKSGTIALLEDFINAREVAL